MESSINAPHPHGESDPADFFGDESDGAEPTLAETEPRPTPSGAAPAEDLSPPPEIPAPPEAPEEEETPEGEKPADVVRNEKLREIAEREQAEASAEAAPAPQEEPTAPTEPPGAAEDAQDAQDGAGEQVQPEPAPAPQEPEGSGGRQYHVLREIELTVEMAEVLLKRAQDGKRTVLFMTLESAFSGRNPTQTGKAVFKKHHERLGVGGYGQDPLTVIPVPHSAWNRMPLGIKPRPTDDNIEVVG